MPAPAINQHRANLPMASIPIITLTTDFGLANEYVATMKGVILTFCPVVTLIDLSHQIGPQDIPGAAFTLARAWRYFPPGTIHLAVVDPGVGSDRRIIAVEAGGQTFLAPDNGLLSPILMAGEVTAAYQVSNRQLFLASPSSTFHGRDIFAPVVGRLAAGMAIHEVGPPIEPDTCLTLPPARLEISATLITGEIIHIDHFGNLCTSITAAAIARLNAVPEKLEVVIGTTVITGISPNYDGPHQSEPLIILYDSHSHLEIAAVKGSAAALLKARRGQKVTLRSTHLTS